MSVLMFNVFLNNHWTRVYARIIARARHRTKKRGDGLERHHIIPKSFWKMNSPTGWVDGDSESPDNLVYLTAREHFIAHRILIRITADSARGKMISALWRMNKTRKKTEGTTSITGRSYSLLREAALEVNRLASINRWRDPKMAAYMLARQREVVSTAEARSKNSAALRRPETVKKIGDAVRSAASRPETKIRRSLASKEVQRRPEVQNKILQAKRDHTVYQFIHVDGRQFVGARWQLEQSYNLPRRSLHKLFAKVPRKHTHGWSVTGTVTA